jgi:pyruvate/2-oxoglutarate dehydrogenase complex dihydrolipoamide dehydrogenase (E3) component
LQAHFDHVLLSEGNKPDGFTLSFQQIDLNPDEKNDTLADSKNQTAKRRNECGVAR